MEVGVKKCLGMGGIELHGMDIVEMGGRVENS